MKFTKVLKPLLMAAAVTSSQAWAVYSRPVSWADMSSLDLKPILRSDYGSYSNLYEPVIDGSASDIALRDADSLINPVFHVPPAMRSHVEFWLKIYTEYSTQQMVIFDERHPELVYEALDFRELAKTARNRVVYEIVARQRQRKAMSAYRAAFARLSKNPAPRKPNREERIILARLKYNRHKHSFAELSKNLRIQTGQRDNIVKGLLAAETFFPRIEALFQSVGVPVELSRLSLVESSFNLNSVSRVGAAGVWQWMPKSAKEYMLLDDRHQIDERLSPLKSSVASAKLLKRNYAMLGNWASAVISYNHGFRGLPRKGSPNATLPQVVKMLDLCTKKSPLGWASRNYYAEFLAVVHAEAYRRLFYGEPPVHELRPTAFQRITAGKSATQLAAEFRITPQEFKLLNPDVKNLHKPLPKGLWIAVPAEDDNIAVLLSQKRPLKIARN